MEKTKKGWVIIKQGAKSMKIIENSFRTKRENAIRSVTANMGPYAHNYLWNKYKKELGYRYVKAEHTIKIIEK